ncbi:MAG: C45 family autoproteolytic acyltransferase/hydrolase [Chloroflexi bacterium]|nr:C45 family autoproteolytic acyltransferase/hydrolase [Chloroflexota bacterium]
MPPIRLAHLSGAPYALGYAHGKAFADEIATLTEERMRLSCDPFWTGGRQANYAEVIALGKACLDYHEKFSPELMDELRGMAAATGLGVNELVIMNGFTDFVDTVANPKAVRDAMIAQSNPPPQQTPDQADAGGCTAFIVEPSITADGKGYIGQTWDMHTTATPHVIMLDIQPENGPALLTFTITGCVGMVGLNEHGVAVGINNLLGKDGRAGVHWPFVVRKMLAQRNVEAALAVLTRARLSGAHNYVLMGPDETGALQGYNIEATATRCHVTEAQGFVAHSNHCLIDGLVALERPRKGVSLASTQARLAQANHYLDERRGTITIDTLIDLTRYHEGEALSVCAHAQPGYDVESSGACIMSPTTRELWAVWGNPCQNAYERFVVEGVRV